MAISQNFPNTRPSLNLNFARSKKLDPRITFTRSSTATYVDEDGLIKSAATNTPRFDHNPTTGDCLGLLIEESRTNLLLRSQEWATSPWNTIVNNVVGGAGGTGGFTVTNNVTISPDGTSNASQMNSTSFTAGDSVYQDATATGTGTYTLSTFVKGGTCNNITMAAFFRTNSVQGFSFSFNPLTGLITGTGGGSNHTVVSYPNGWYRIYFTVTGTNALNTGLRFQVYTNATGITYLWGAQLEAGAFPTSYIPTVASTVTRTADNASITGTNFSNFYNQSEGSILGVYDRISTGFITNVYPAIAYFGAWPTRIALMDFGGTGSSSQQFDVVISGTWQAQFFTDSVATPVNTNRSVIGAYKQDNFAAVGNGKNLQTDTSGNIPTVSSFAIGWDFAVTNYLNGHISQLTYYPVRLSNSQLQTLTK